MRKEGYRIWRIAEQCRVSANDVLEVLVDAGLERLDTCDLVLAAEAKPTREQTQERVDRMRARRKRENLERRVGGGTWNGR